MIAGRPAPFPLALPSAGGAVAEIRWSIRADGDFHRDQPAADLDAVRQRFLPGAWTQPNEVHGTAVAVVAEPGEHDGCDADAVVTRCLDAVLGIWVGDCAPVALVSDDGVIAAAHAGWRGAHAGVLQRTVAAMRTDAPVRAVLGPCIHPCCYEFGEGDLADLSAAHGSAVVSTAASGAPALDMRALVRAVLAPLGVAVIDRSVCTGCHGDTFFSHRVRAERGRQVMTVRKVATGTAP